MTLKFRAYDKFNDCFYYSSKAANLAKFFSDMQILSDAGNGIEIKQYICSRDRDGVEIYEGDKLQAPSGFIATVKWHEEELRWAMVDNAGFWYNMNCGILRVVNETK